MSMDDDDDEIDTDELFKHRESIDLTPENAWFSKSTGGLISLKITMIVSLFYDLPFSHLCRMIIIIFS